MAAPPDVWQELRALRAAPPDSVADDPERREVFSAALRQAEQLAIAADAAGYEAKPILSFYALSQVGRAIAAARLEDNWRLRGHGLSVPDAAPALLETTVSPAQGANSSFKRVGQAIESQPLDGPVALGGLWAANPDLNEVPVPQAEGEWPRSLRMDLGPRELFMPIPLPGGEKPDPDTTMIGVGMAVSVSVALRGRTARAVEEEVALYPSLAGARAMPAEMGPEQRFAEGDEAVQVGAGDTDETLNIGRAVDSEQLSYTEYWKLLDEFASYFEWLPGGMAPQRIGFALPGIGGGPAPHPLMLWWALLLGLSSLARYQPARWVAALDLDRSELAVRLERVLDLAETRVPERLLEELEHKTEAH